MFQPLPEHPTSCAMPDDCGQVIAHEVRPSKMTTAHANPTQEPANMLFMVIERFAGNDMVPVYQRVRTEGRMLPDGLEYVESWVEPNFARCFQLMRCNDLRLFQEWALKWRGSGATFEIVPVVPSQETMNVVAPYLDDVARSG
jgi:Protein of unknown function (DUF3303)